MTASEARVCRARLARPPPPLLSSRTTGEPVMVMNSAVSGYEGLLDVNGAWHVILCVRFFTTSRQILMTQKDITQRFNANVSSGMRSMSVK